MPRPQLCGRLRYRGGSRGPRLSLLHLKLTDPALRALRTCQRLQGSAQPVVAFQGSQGYIKIPGSPGTGARLFTFYLSRYSKDKPQASFDCVRQYVSRLGRKQLDCVGSIQEKITVCATDGSCQLTQERVSQAEAAWSRAASEIKPEAPGHGQRVASPTEPGGKGSAGSSSRRPQGPERGALATCLVQLLALRPHCKHQLLERLARAQGGRLARAQLLPLLSEVGQLGPRRGSYRLKEELFGQVQEDWLGYTPEERQLLRRRRARRAEARPFLAPLECPSCQRAGGRPLGVTAAPCQAPLPPWRSSLTTAGRTEPSAPWSSSRPTPRPSVRITLSTGASTPGSGTSAGPSSTWEPKSKGCPLGRQSARWWRSESCRNTSGSSRPTPATGRRRTGASIFTKSCPTSRASSWTLRRQGRPKSPQGRGSEPAASPSRSQALVVLSWQGSCRTEHGPGPGHLYLLPQSSGFCSRASLGPLGCRAGLKDGAGGLHQHGPSPSCAGLAHSSHG
ncbi:RNA polymerase II elongation factor ELL3 isoform X1 [Pelodiscus sinensis]|uniref:RNA polymerase II elongation factor ELL3 isoform X1 n=1 Tax=Pelodiscus sinensis TaxID=13735 RepID=UPI003F6D0429